MSHKAFLSVLKETTSHCHVALEGTRLSQHLLSPHLTREQYSLILYAFYGAFVPLERLLLDLYKAANGRHIPIPEERAPLARKDIEFLTGTFRPAYLLENPPQLADDQSSAIARALGIMYVLEGSKLGGKIISRHLSNVLAITPKEGGCFFADTEGTGIAGWKAFQHACESYAEQHPAQFSGVVEAANAVFQYLIEYFDQYAESYSVS